MRYREPNPPCYSLRNARTARCMRGSAVLTLALYILIMMTTLARGQSNDGITSASLFPCGSGSGCSPSRQEVCLLSLPGSREPQQGADQGQQGAEQGQQGAGQGQQGAAAGQVVEKCVAGGDLWNHCAVSGDRQFFIYFIEDSLQFASCFLYIFLLAVVKT